MKRIKFILKVLLTADRVADKLLIASERFDALLKDYAAVMGRTVAEYERQVFEKRINQLLDESESRKVTLKRKSSGGGFDV